MPRRRPRRGSSVSTAAVAINARAAVRDQIGGVERMAGEMARRLPVLRPERYRVLRPPRRLAHRAGHAWEQVMLPASARDAALIYSPANLAPVLSDKNVLVLHDLAALRYPIAYSRTYVAYQRLMLPALARRARLLITVSEFSRNELAELLDLDPGRIVVIPEGVDGAFMRADAIAIQAVGVNHRLDRPYVLTVGTVSARKNLTVLAPAARVLAARGIDLVLAGSDRGYLRAEPVLVRRLGYVPEEELPALYAGALALVLASRYEGFGLPCLEAMAAGTPVVATNCGALPETVGDAGVLLDPDDAEGFSSMLLRLADDAEERARLAAAGRRRAALFSWNHAAELTDRAIDQLLGRTDPIRSEPCSIGSRA